MSKFRTLLLLFIALMTFTIPSIAQEEEEEAPVESLMPPSTVIEISASDGLTLVGDFYFVGPDQPTVLLLHQMYTTRASWRLFTRFLVESGYNAMVVDLRGYGATRGSINWQKATDDVQSWLTWLRNEGGVRGDAISVMGSSMGANLAIVGCANDPYCWSAIAISPGWNYFGVNAGRALQEKMGERPVLAIYSTRDYWPARGIPQMQGVASVRFVAEEYAGNIHGIDLFRTEEDTMYARIFTWLANGGY